MTLSLSALPGYWYVLAHQSSVPASPPLPPASRSGASGFLLPLSGGADSSSVAAIVGCMCQMVCTAVAEGDPDVVADAVRCGMREHASKKARPLLF